MFPTLQLALDLRQREFGLVGSGYKPANSGRDAMWWYGCSTAPWMFFGLIMMMIFILACIGMMFLFMRRHPGLGTLSANGGPAMRLGPWRNHAREDAPTSAAFA